MKLIKFVGLIVLNFYLVVDLRADIDSVDIWYSQAKKYMEIKKYKKALPLLLKAAQKKPGLLSLQEDLLKVSQELKNKDAEKVARRNLAKIYVQLGKNKLYSKNPSLIQLSVNDFRKALEYDSTYIEGYLYMAEYYWRNGRLDEAEKYYLKLTKIYPDSAQGWQGLGWLYGLLKKDYQKSVEYYNKALEKSPDNPDIIFGLAKVFELSGNPQKADSLYKEAIKRKPDNIGLIKSYGMFLSDTMVRRYTQSITYLEKALKEKPNDKELHERIAKTYLILLDSVKTKAKKRQYSKKALKSLNWLISQKPDEYLYYLDKAKVFEKIKLKDSTVFYYNKSCELAPERAKLGIKINLSLYYLYDLKRPVKARSILTEVLKDTTLATNLEGTIYYLIGNTYYFEAGQKMRIAKKTKGKKKRNIFKQAYNIFQNAISYYNKAISLGEKRAITTKKKAEELSKVCYRKWKGIE